jgi:predicted porin
LAESSQLPGFSEEFERLNTHRSLSYQSEENFLMNKKVMALAVAGVLTAPAAFAQSSNVQLYGRANLGIDMYSAEGARSQGAVPGDQIDYQSRTRIFDNGSRVGLRGTEDLGNGLRAIFQIESGVNVDNGATTGQAGTANASAGTWASRDSFVGVDSGFGRVTFGRQSIYWANGELAQFQANYINLEVPWTNGTQLGRVSRSQTVNGQVIGPVARQSNVVAYTTPTFSGFNATLSYSPNAGEAVQHNLTTGTNTDGAVWGATVRGAIASFHGQFDYVQNEGNGPNSGAASQVTPKFTGYKAGLGWKYMPGANLSFIWVRSENNAAFGETIGTKVNQNGYTINWEHTFGNIQAMAQYGWLDNMKGCTGAVGTIGCSDTKATAYMVGARYLLSKRTWLYATYNLVDNKNNNFSDYTGASMTSVAGNGAVLLPMGADPEVWALGVFHAF